MDQSLLPPLSKNLIFSPVFILLILSLKPSLFSKFFKLSKLSLGEVVKDTDWNRYKVKNDSAPLIIVSHICSTRVPYKTVGKENVADRPEIEKELRLALQFLSRKLSGYMSKKGQAEMAKKRANLYSKYLPLVAQFCTELSGNKKEPNYKKMIKEEISIEEKTD